MDTATAIIICAIMVFNYLVLFQKHRLAGYLVFFVMGLTIVGYSAVDIENAAGMLIVIGSFASFIMDLLEPIRTNPRWGTR